MAGYRWARLDTTYLRNTKVVDVSTSAVLLHLASILHCVEQLTDGQVSARSLPALAIDARLHQARARTRVDELVDRGLWLPNGSGWHVHDYEAMQPQAMREHVERERAAWRERQRRRRVTQ